MILNDEQLAEFEQRRKEGRLWGLSFGNTVSDFMDTVADLKRQIAERDATVSEDSKQIAKRIYAAMAGDGTFDMKEVERCLDAYVQEKIQKALALQAGFCENVKKSLCMREEGM